MGAWWGWWVGQALKRCPYQTRAPEADTGPHDALESPIVPLAAESLKALGQAQDTLFLFIVRRGLLGKGVGCGRAGPTDRNLMRGRVGAVSHSREELGLLSPFPPVVPGHCSSSSRSEETGHGGLAWAQPGSLANLLLWCSSPNPRDPKKGLSLPEEACEKPPQKPKPPLRGAASGLSSGTRPPPQGPLQLPRHQALSSVPFCSCRCLFLLLEVLPAQTAPPLGSGLSSRASSQRARAPACCPCSSPLSAHGRLPRQGLPSRPNGHLPTTLEAWWGMILSPLAWAPLHFGAVVVPSPHVWSLFLRKCLPSLLDHQLPV